jgi:hypothetical protein
METAARAAVQARYDGALAELERVFEYGLAQVKAQYPPAGEGRGTDSQADQILSLAAAMEAVLIGLTLPPRTRTV